MTVCAQSVEAESGGGQSAQGGQVLAHQPGASREPLVAGFVVFVNRCSFVSHGRSHSPGRPTVSSTAAGRQPGDAFESCGDLLINTLASTEYRPTTMVLQPGTYFQDEVQPGIYVSGPITGEFCSSSARDEWGYTTNQAFVSSEGLSQTVTAMMILPIDRTVEIDSDCGPLTLVEAWAR